MGLSGRTAAVLAIGSSCYALLGSAFLLPTERMSPRGFPVMMSASSSNLNPRLAALGGDKPASLDGMTQSLGVQALEQFQKRRTDLLKPNDDRETVEATMLRFNLQYKRPIIPFYRTTLYELVQTAHLAVNDATFKYTHLFAYGFVYAFETIFKGYPVPDEYKKLFEAAAKSAQLDPEQLRKDAEKLEKYMSSGKSTEDFLRAIESPSDDPIERDLYMVKSSKSFLPERYFSFGLCKLMEASGVEVTWESIKTWTNKLGLDETRTQLDWDLLERTVKKLGEVELLMKQVEIREKKRLAERLETKAKQAADAAAASLAAAAAAQAEVVEEDKKKPAIPSPVS